MKMQRTRQNKLSAIQKSAVVLGFLGFVAVNFIAAICALAAFVILFPYKNARAKAISKTLKTALSAEFFVLLKHIGALKVKVDGAEYAKVSGAVFVSNHQSFLDPLLLLSLIDNCGVVMKKKYSGILAIRLLTKIFDFVVVDETADTNIKFAVEKFCSPLKNGRNMLIFPEGSRAYVGTVRPFKKAAFKLAKDVSAKLVFVAIKTPTPVFARDRDVVENYPAEYEIKFFKPIEPEQIENPSEAADAACEMVRKFQNCTLPK